MLCMHTQVHTHTHTHIGTPTYMHECFHHLLLYIIIKQCYVISIAWRTTLISMVVKVLMLNPTNFLHYYFVFPFFSPYGPSPIIPLPLYSHTKPFTTLTIFLSLVIQYLSSIIMSFSLAILMLAILTNRC
jgi:hypothetical protein